MALTFFVAAIGAAHARQQETPGRDVINALGGNDKVNGLGGNDRLCGGNGKDKLKGAGVIALPARWARKDVYNGAPGKDKAKACEKERNIPLLEPPDPRRSPAAQAAGLLRPWLARRI